MRIGWRVHGWRYPVVWFARKKPRSRFRQRLWDAADWLHWHLVLRPLLRRIGKRERDE